MDHLLQAAVRSVLLAAVAALGLWRVKSASIRHAVWTLVTASMLLQIALGPLLPELPLRVLHPAEPIAVAFTTSQPAPGAAAVQAPTPQSVLSWPMVAAAVYFCGLMFFAVRLSLALVFARELLRTSEPTPPGAGRACQSHRISAPVTIGNRILLPMSWSEWNSAKLAAVLAHEESHVRRHDWAIAAMARLNECVFWFHPLAWWLERQLARLAEQACDDAALAQLQDRQQYARTLLDIARSIHFSKGRVLAVPMAKEANVETRINRILDETRRIPRALGRRGWTALALLAAPLIYMAATIQLAPAQTMMSVPQPAPPSPPPTPVVMIAQAPAPQAAPVPPQPPAPPVPPPSPAAEAKPRPRDYFGGALGVGGPVSIPQVYNGVNKTFLFFNYEDYAKSQADLGLRGRWGKPPGDLQVEVTSVRLTMIAIPLDPSGQYEITGQIRTPERTFIAAFDESADHLAVMEKQMPLKPGTYRLRVAVRNLTDGKVDIQETSFEVK